MIIIKLAKRLDLHYSTAHYYEGSKGKKQL